MSPSNIFKASEIVGLKATMTWEHRIPTSKNLSIMLLGFELGKFSSFTRELSRASSNFPAFTSDQAQSVIKNALGDPDDDKSRAFLPHIISRTTTPKLYTSLFSVS
ncbi:hypothetical protein VIGAN_05007600 [Vigna angularis var. angularis]|uniref:Uncharacterized protein n=1 Tax=Vigna angularis var. angularis TaxID=157739 RepID=A0A0S3S1U2_PHAAN|nr:hypothetical protein VIGAN_05007600 [Vigna angularis var. angularis]